MTHRAGAGPLGTKALTRVEGEGAMHVEIVDGHLEGVTLQIYEPPRFYEGFLRGRGHTEPPDITARICGICPVAYQMSACLAIEQACRVEVTDGNRRAAPTPVLRRVDREPHVAHPHAPRPGLPRRRQRRRSGRARPSGGRTRTRAEEDRQRTARAGRRPRDPPGERAGRRLLPPADPGRAGERSDPGSREALELAVEVCEWVAGFEFPELDTDHELVALDDGDHYPVFGDRIVSDRGLDIAIDDFASHIEEFQVSHSTAKHARLLSRGNYLVGPLARYRLAREKLSPAATAAASAAGLGSACPNPFRSIIVRAVEVIHACEEALRITDGVIDGSIVLEPGSVEVPARAGTGHGATEAPRGLLYHRYTLDHEGTITDAEIVPPTSQNQPTIEHDLYHFVEARLGMADDALARAAEVTIRNHDPCISCATHFLDLTVDRRERTP